MGGGRDEINYHELRPIITPECSYDRINRHRTNSPAIATTCPTRTLIAKIALFPSSFSCREFRRHHKGCRSQNSDTQHLRVFEHREINLRSPTKPTRTPPSIRFPAPLRRWFPTDLFCNQYWTPPTPLRVSAPIPMPQNEIPQWDSHSQPSPLAISCTLNFVL